MLFPLMALALFLAASVANAAQVTVVLSADQPAFREVLAGVRSVLPDAGLTILGKGALDIGDADVVVAVGDQAAAASYPSRVQLVTCMVADPSLLADRKCVRVDLLPHAFTLMSTANNLTKHLNTLAVFDSKKRFTSYAKYLAAAAKVSMQSVSVHEVDGAQDLVEALRSLKDQAEALWVAPDPGLIDGKDFKFISDFCLANGISLIAPLAPLVRMGALASLAPGNRSMGQAAGQAAGKLASGKPCAPHLSAADSEVLINPGTAGTLGLTLTPSMGTLLR